MKAIIIDDERPARTEMKRLLKPHPEIEIIGEAAMAGPPSTTSGTTDTTGISTSQPQLRIDEDVTLNYSYVGGADLKTGAGGQALSDMVEGRLERANEIERFNKELLGSSMMLTKEETAERLCISIAHLDRAVKRGEIQARYQGRMPRFQLTEIIRYENALPTSPPRKRKS